MEQKQLHLNEQLTLDQHRMEHIKLYGALTWAIQIYHDEVTKEELDKFSIVEFATWFKTQNALVGTDTKEEGWSKEKEDLFGTNSKFIDGVLLDYIAHQKDLNNIDLARTSIRKLLNWAARETIETTPAIAKEDQIRTEVDEEEAAKQALPNNFKE